MLFGLCYKLALKAFKPLKWEKEGKKKSWRRALGGVLLQSCLPGLMLKRLKTSLLHQ